MKGTIPWGMKFWQESRLTSSGECDFALKWAWINANLKRGGCYTESMRNLDLAADTLMTARTCPPSMKQSRKQFPYQEEAPWQLLADCTAPPGQCASADLCRHTVRKTCHKSPSPSFPTEGHPNCQAQWSDL